jgi:2,4-dienoyl-CoA reductase-like NADH-dependent reductase (Old Yellow Enzyme family)
MMAEYYRQRSGAGLIISEATSVTPMGVGYPNTPGIWSREQVEGWKLVTRAVHEAGGRILLQLWHVGRVSDPSPATELDDAENVSSCRITSSRRALSFATRRQEPAEQTAAVGRYARLA